MEVLRGKVNDHVMSTWLEPVVCEEISEGKLTLSVPNNFFAAWIKDNYLSLLLDSLLELTGISYEVAFRCRDDSCQNNLPTLVHETPSKPDASFVITEDFALRRNLNPRYTFESFVV
jgi:chromosomal replication initiation ATPase DnaA